VSALDEEARDNPIDYLNVVCSRSCALIGMKFGERVAEEHHVRRQLTHEQRLMYGPRSTTQYTTWKNSHRLRW